MPSASSPALSRVVSPNRTHVLCCSSSWGWGGVTEGRVGGGTGFNRLVKSIGDLALGPFPCRLSPSGDVFRCRILDGSG